MSRWIRENRIIDEDFSYLCGSLVAGLYVGYYVNKRYIITRRIGLTTADNSYATYVGKIIKRLTGLNPAVKEYKYKWKFKNKIYEKPLTFLQLNVPSSQIDLWVKLKTLKDNFRKLNELILNSNREIQSKFLQAIMDAKASPCRAGKRDLDINLPVNSKQFPIISSILNAYNIHHTYSLKKDPKFILIRTQKDVDKIINEIGFNSERVKNKIKELVGDLYSLS